MIEERPPSPDGLRARAFRFAFFDNIYCAVTRNIYLSVFMYVFLFVLFSYFEFFSFLSCCCWKQYTKRKKKKMKQKHKTPNIYCKNKEIRLD